MSRTAIVLSALLLLAPSLGLGQTFDEPTVRKIMADIDRASAARDIAGVARHLSEGATLTVEMEADGQPQRLTMSKPEYIEAIRQAWAGVETYDYRRSNVKISLSGGNRAVVTATVVETVTMQGKTMRTTSAETSVVELVAGKPLVTSVFAKTQM